MCMMNVSIRPERREDYRAIRFGLTSDYTVPDDVLMLRELTDGSLDNLRGRIKDHRAFNDL